MVDLDEFWQGTKRFAGAAAEGASNAAKGLAEDVVNVAEGAWQLATDPAAREEAWQTAEQLAEATKRYAEATWQDPAKPFLDARDAALNAYTEFEKARLQAEAEGRSVEFWGEIIGGAGFEIVTSAVGGVIVKGVAKGTTGVRVLADAVDETAEASRNVDAAATARAVLEEPALDAPDSKPDCITRCVEGQELLGPSGKRWDDPTMTAEEFIQDYRARYPATSLSDERLRQEFEEGQRLNPETGRLKVPRYQVPEGLKRPEPLPAPGTPAYEQWQQWERGNPNTVPCFPAGTPVKTPAGNVSIDTLAPGMQIYAFDPARGTVISAVTSVHRHYATELVLIETPFARMHATPNHPYWVEQKAAWIAAGQLRSGMCLRLLKGGSALVLAAERYVAHEATFNITVQEQRTYYVSEVGFLVHNAEPPQSAYASGMAHDTNIYFVSDSAGNVVYVGQTQQDLAARLRQHVNDPKSALYIADPEIRETFQEIYTIDRETGGRWTAYEAAVWEQHVMDVKRAEGAQLLNRQEGIDPVKAEKFRDLHNPCR